jgi:hypothetical protein
MDQTNRGFRSKEKFTHSCLGRIIIFAGIILVLLILAFVSVPNKETMTEEIEDDIRELIQTHDSIQADKIDDYIGNVSHIFTHADSTFDHKTWTLFEKYNRLEYHKRAFYSSMHVHNNFHPEGVRIGIGIFGVVIPTVTYNDILLRVGPMHKGYNDGVLQKVNFDDGYMGDQPHIREYHYQGDQTQ